MTGPLAKALPAVSPSRFQTLKDCFLQVAFSQSTDTKGARSDAQIVGEVAHKALEWLVKGGAPFEPRRSAIDDYFVDRLASQAPGREVAGARPARSRLRKVAARSVALIETAGAAASIRTEQRLEGRDGRLVGIIDLAIASPMVHVIVDYKTGPAVDDEGALVRHIEEQLAIYCLLEQEATEAWPQRAFVFGFRAAPVEWNVDPAVCEGVSAAALQLRDAYERHVGSVPPASPRPSACRHCSFAPRCGAFWSALDPSWADAVQAVRGRVKWARQTTAGEVTLALTDCVGTAVGDVVVQQVPSQLLSAEALQEGTTVALAGLWTDRQGRLKAGRSLRSWTEQP